MSTLRPGQVATLLLVALAGACGGSRGSVLPSIPLPWPRDDTPPPSSPARADVTPRSGLEVIGAMRRAHPSRQLRSLSFSVTVNDAQRADRATQAKAAASLPGRFRLTALPTKQRSGFVRNQQRLAIFERGRRLAAPSRVDLSMLLVYDVFAQGIDSTVRWLDLARVRFGLARKDEFHGRRAWVVGAPAGDLRSSQFWVDAERWHVVRVIQPDPRAPSKIMDVRYAEFTYVLGVPVPTRMEVYRDGKLDEEHVMSNLAANPKLPANTFDLTTWRDVRVD